MSYIFNTADQKDLLGPQTIPLTDQKLDNQAFRFPSSDSNHNTELPMQSSIQYNFSSHGSPNNLNGQTLTSPQELVFHDQVLYPSQYSGYIFRDGRWQFPLMDQNGMNQSFSYSALDNNGNKKAEMQYSQNGTNGRIKNNSDDNSDQTFTDLNNECQDLDLQNCAPKPEKRKISAKRAAQNRAAQKAFRQRRDQYVKNLESKVLELVEANKTIAALKYEIERLHKRIQDLSNMKKIESDAISE